LSKIQPNKRHLAFQALNLAFRNPLMGEEVLKKSALSVSDLNILSTRFKKMPLKMRIALFRKLKLMIIKTRMRK